MIEIELTPRPEIAGIEIEVIADEGEDFLTLTRTDANGHNEVRLYAGQLVSSSVAGVLTAVDTEAALTGPIKYAVEASDGAVATAMTSLEGLVSHARLSPAVLASGGIPVAMVMDYAASRPGRSTEFEVVGRSAPLFGIAPQASRRVTLGLFAQDYADARRIEAMANGQVLQFRNIDPEFVGQDMYFIPESAEVSPLADETATRRWYVRLSCVEVDFPRGNLAGSYGWNIARALAEYPIIQDSINAFGTIGEATRGPVEYV